MSALPRESTGGDSKGYRRRARTHSFPSASLGFLFLKQVTWSHLFTLAGAVPSCDSICMQFTVFPTLSVPAPSHSPSQETPGTRGVPRHTRDATHWVVPPPQSLTFRFLSFINSHLFPNIVDNFILSEQLFYYLLCSNN